MFRITTGAIVVLISLWLLVVGLAEGFGAIIPGLILLAVGVAILINKHEDDIEEITNDKE